MASRGIGSKVLAIVLTGMLVIPLVPAGAVAAAPASAKATRKAMQFGASPIRVQGKRPYGPAIAISRRGWPKGSKYVVLVNYASKTDQLLAGPLAGAYGAPILYTAKNGIPSAVIKEIRRLRASRVFVVGSGRTISSRVIRQLPRARISRRRIKRLGGRNDYHTARLVAAQIRAAKRGLAGVIIVAKAQRYWATGAVPLAGRLGMPILLTTRSKLPLDAARVLKRYRPKRAIILGSTRRISEAQRRKIRSLARMRDTRMTRLSIGNSYDAAAKLSELSYMEGFEFTNVVLGSAEDIADPLAAGPWVARLGGMLLLTNHRAMPRQTDDFLQSHCTSIQRVYALGDKRTILPHVLTAAKQAAETIIKPEAKVMSAQANGELVEVSPDLSLMRFNDGPALANVQASDVIASGPTALAPNGYLRRVLSVGRSPSGLFASGLVSLTTTQATLGDVFQKGSIDIRSDESPPDPESYRDAFSVQGARSVDRSHVDVSFGGGTVDTFDTVSAAAAGTGRKARESASGDLWSHNLSLDKTIYQSGNTRKLRTEGSLSGRLSYSWNYSWGATKYKTVKVKYWCVRHWRWEYWTKTVPYMWGVKKCGVTLGFQEDLTLKVLWKGKFTHNKEVEIGRYQCGTIYFQAGPVPVVITMYIMPVVGASGSFEGEGSAGFKMGYYTSGGFQYHYESGFNSTKSWFAYSSRLGPTGCTTVTAKSWTKLKAEGLAYDVLGISPMVVPCTYVEAQTGFGGTETRKDGTTAGYSWYKLWNGQSLEVGGRLNLLGFVKEWYWGPWTLFRWLVASGDTRRWSAGSTSPHPGSSFASWSAAESEGSPPESGMTTVTLTASTVQPGDFTIQGLTVTDAQVQPDGSTVRLTTTRQERDKSYFVAVADGSISETRGRTVLGSSAGFAGYGRLGVAGASAVTSRSVDVSFDNVSDLDASTVEPTDFSIQAVGLAGDAPVVSAAAVQPDGKTVRLTTGLLYPARGYRVSVPEAAVSDGRLTNAAGSADFAALAPALTVSPESIPAPAADRWGTAIRFADADRGYVGRWQSSGAQVLYTNDGGQTWLDSWSPTGLSGPVVTDFAFRGGDPGQAVLVGYDGLYIAGAPPRTHASPSMAARAWPPPQLTWHAYNFGRPWIATLQGGTWTDQTLAEQLDWLWSGAGYGDARFPTNSVDFASTNVGYINGHPNRLQTTSDGGVTWTLHSQDSSATTPSATGIPPARLRFAPGGTHGWAVGGNSIARTTNGGATWSNQLTTAPGTLEGLHVHDSQTAWAVGGNGTILHTSNGGASWAPQVSGVTTQTLRGVSFADAYHGYAVGDDTILHTWDGGRTWTRVPRYGTYTGVAAPRFDRAFVVGRGPAGHAIERIDLGW